MPILIFIFYLLLFSFLVTRIPFFTKSGLSKWQLVFLFIIKVAAGLAYAWFYKLPTYTINSDTYRFFSLSLQETDWLLKNPWAFFKDIFNHNYTNSGNIFIAENSYWNDLKSNVIIKLLAVCNVFTFKNYYANIIFFNFLFLFGLVAFYKLMSLLFTNNKWLLIAAIFLTPSFLFWCSGVHKDGLLFSAIGLVFWLFYQLLNKKFLLKNSLAIVLLLILIFSLRNYVCFALLISLFCWFLAHHFKHSILPFIAVYSLGIILFFTASFFNSQLNFPNYIVSKHQEFEQLSGGSLVITKKLEPTVSSFLNYLPSAVDMAFFRPHFSEIKNKSYLPAIAEVFFTLLLIVVCVIFRNKKIPISPPILACWFFGITILLIAGYTITFSGAIVRYKSLVTPFILAPLIGLLDTQKIIKTLRILINYKK